MQLWITVAVGMIVAYGLMILIGWLIIELMSRTLSLSDFNPLKEQLEHAPPEPNALRRH